MTIIVLDKQILKSAHVIGFNRTKINNQTKQKKNEINTQQLLNENGDTLLHVGIETRYFLIEPNKY